MNRMHSLFALALASVALGSAACAAPQAADDDEYATALDQAATRQNVTCVTNSGDHSVTQAQCEKLLAIAGCKAGAVVGGKQKCSTASTLPGASNDGPDDFSLPPPRPVLVTCVTITGNHSVTQAQCETLLRASGCEPGAVVNNKQKCSTASTDPTAPGDGPDDITAAPPPSSELITCVTNTGEHRVTQEQCEKLLTIAGCTPGAVVGGKQKCSTAD